MKQAELNDFLDAKAQQYEHPQFLLSDPIQIPHLFSRKEDVELSAFLTATIAWGNRKSIITNAKKMMHLMQNAPYDFVMGYSDKQQEDVASFVHRTFNSSDLHYFLKSLQNIYTHHGGLEAVFARKHGNLQDAISNFKTVFFELPHPTRTTKHISDPAKGSAAKRINMFLRWMVRSADKGVDLGLWNAISTADLSCPLDVHSGNVARKLGLLHRKQNDAKALKELDASLRKFDADDPVKYDFALFGLGVFEKF